MFTTVSNNHIENFGKQLYDNTVYTNFSTVFPATAIWLSSARGAIIEGNTIAQTGSYANTSGIIGGEEPCAIRLSKADTYINGSTQCLVKDNIILDVPRPFLDQDGNSANRWDRNIYSGNSVPVIITPADSIVITPESKGSFTPTLAGTVGNFTTYDLQQGYYYRNGDVVNFEVYIDLSATTGGSGNISISGLPFAAKSTSPNAIPVCFSVLSSGQLSHSSASYTEFAGHINAGTTSVQLFEIGSSAILALTEARFGSNTRIAVAGSYICNS